MAKEVKGKNFKEFEKDFKDWEKENGMKSSDEKKINLNLFNMDFRTMHISAFIFSLIALPIFYYLLSKIPELYFFVKSIAFIVSLSIDNLDENSFTGKDEVCLPVSITCLIGFVFPFIAGLIALRAGGTTFHVFLLNLTTAYGFSNLLFLFFFVTWQNKNHKYYNSENTFFTESMVLVAITALTALQQFIALF